MVPQELVTDAVGKPDPQIICLLRARHHRRRRVQQNRIRGLDRHSPDICCQRRTLNNGGRLAIKHVGRQNTARRRTRGAKGRSRIRRHIVVDRGRQRCTVGRCDRDIRVAPGRPLNGAVHHTGGGVRAVRRADISADQRINRGEQQVGWRIAQRVEGNAQPNRIRACRHANGKRGIQFGCVFGIHHNGGVCGNGAVVDLGQGIGKHGIHRQRTTGGKTVALAIDRATARRTASDIDIGHNASLRQRLDRDGPGCGYRRIGNSRRCIAVHFVPCKRAANGIGV